MAPPKNSRQRRTKTKQRHRGLRGASTGPEEASRGRRGDRILRYGDGFGYHCKSIILARGFEESRGGAKQCRRDQGP